MTMYANAAERQKAYRARYREQVEQRITQNEARIAQLQKAVDELQCLLGQIGMAGEREEAGREAA